MKYPKQYSEKAMSVLGANYFTEGEDVENVALLTLAAHCINLVAQNADAEISFEMVREMVQEPEALPTVIE